MTEAPTLGSAGQTFLVGDAIYLRGLELADAKRASAWRASPFPIPAERAEEILKKDVPAQAERHKLHLLACRRADDEPVGAVTIEINGWRTALLRLHTDRPGGTAAPDAAATAVKAELLGLVVPWLSAERHLMVVWTEIDAGDAAVLAAAEALGMRPAFRLREALWRDGRRRDQVTYEILHAAWVERLGDPGPGITAAGEPVRTARSPARSAAPADRPEGPTAPPRNAVMVGERLVLRPMEVDDAEAIARWSREETETFWDNGRPVRSPLVLAHFTREDSKSDPPADIEFAIALRDGGELIGDNGLYGIDWVHRTAETGTYIYRPQHRGGGLGTEAKHLLLAYAFDRLGLHMVRSFVWGPNTRSATALRKQGYRDAGRLRWTSLQGGEFVDDLAFDLLAGEWRAHRDAR